MNRRYVFALAVSAILLLTFSLVSAQSSDPAGLSSIDGAKSSLSRYIVQLNDAPAVRYDGGVRSLAGTSRTATGTARYQGYTPAVEAYTNYLASQQAAVQSSAESLLGRSLDVPFNYYHAVNGFATFLTAEEAALLNRLDGVQSVAPLVDQELHTDRGPEWIGATNLYGGTGPGGHMADGSGTVIGIIDTGMNMLGETHPSFADVGSDGYDHTNPLGAGNYRGWCDSDNANYDPNLQCNDKVIGAYDFLGSSPDDVDGHGSHVASTAAGNHVTDSTIVGPTTSVTKDIGGVAPHANLIIYGVEGDDGGCCDGGALLAAVDQITQDADIVDALNYSIGGGDYSPWTADATPLAFLNATEAGILVVTSAGNGGPNPQTLGSPGNSPWMLAVGATTHDRKNSNNLINITSDGDSLSDIEAVGFTSGYGPAPIVYAGDFPNSNDPDGDPAQCLQPYPAGTFSGQIVVCDRGSIARVAKGQNVLAGGAGGFVLANIDAQGEGTSGDAHFLPGVHIGDSDGDVLRAFLANPDNTNATAQITGYIYDVDNANGDILASFSSRGPNTQASVIKPDVAAPGVDIWAAAADDGDQDNGADYQFLSGTSMASPHTAGAAALVRSVNPNWTVPEVYSALMMSAKTDILKDDGVTPADPFDIGAGRIQVDRAANAYLVLDVTTTEFENADPAAGGDPSALNLASMAQANCLGSCSWTRTVRATNDITTTWDLSVTGMDGYDVTVTPASFTMTETGQIATFTVEATVTDAPSEEYVYGTLNMMPTPREGSLAHGLHMPIAAKSVEGELPAVVAISTDDTAGDYTVNGLRTVAASGVSYPVQGLDKATTMDMTLVQDPTDGDPYDGGDGVEFVTVTVEADSLRLVAETFNSTATDIDLFVGTGSTPSAATEVCSSTTPTAVEYCNISGEDLVAGTWWILVQNWAASDAASDTVTLAYGVVQPGADGNMTATGPSEIAAGEEFSIDLAYDVDGADLGDRYYGAVYILPSERAHIGEFNVDLRIFPPEVLEVGGDAVGFELGIPAGWTVEDDAGTGLVWTVTGEGSCANDVNYTTGSPTAACVNSDAYGASAYDTSLISSELDISGASDSCDTVSLDFVTNYRDVNNPDPGLDQMDVDVSTDGGSSWTTLLKLEDDIGGFFSLPGVSYSVDLVDYMGEDSIHVRFRYYNPDAGADAWDWYAQVDDVSLVCQTSASMSLNPTSVTYNIEVDGTSDTTMTMESTGTGDLEFAIHEDGGASAGRAPFNLTQSNSQTIEDGAGVSCGSAAGTAGNEYMRIFDLSAMTFDEPALNIQTIEFGVDQLTLGVPSIGLVGKVYVVDGGTLTLVGSGVLDVTSDIDDQIVSIAVNTFVSADATIAIGVEYPDSGDGSFFFPGVNGEGQAAPSYILASACGLTAPTDYAAIGFDAHHLVMNVLGETGLPDTCETANDIPWMSVSPTSGTIPAGSSADVTMSFDATGLSTGVYTGTVCITNNVPGSTVVQVPVELHVYDQILPPTDVALGEFVGMAQSTQLVAVVTGILLATFAGVAFVRRRRY